MPAPQVDLYGLKNCDSCRRALRWFADRDLACSFHDIRDPAGSDGALALIARQAEWEPFVNRRSTTWRSLPDSDKTDLDRDRALALLATHPTLIKRPLLRIGNHTLAGFDEARVAALAG